jgi:hypothetical protein
LRFAGDPTAGGEVFQDYRCKHDQTTRLTEYWKAYLWKRRCRDEFEVSVTS